MAINIANSDTVFFYGRAFSKNYEGESPINAKIQYEIYCLGCVRNDYGISLVSINLEDSRWFLNTQHNRSAYGDILFFRPTGLSSIANQKYPINGTGTMQLVNGADFTPYQDVIHAKPNSWLIHNAKNENANDISFTVNFIGMPSTQWAGKGAVNQNGDKKAAIGQTIDVMPSRKTSGKMSW
ncbi:MAG: hypothetical protein LBP40_07330 [Campylobacteraceae bacterium]|jgi:hypothetical protein|nr:hypothetical protein [Campylobacteraceae bacterium]